MVSRAIKSLKGHGIPFEQRAQPGGYHDQAVNPEETAEHPRTLFLKGSNAPLRVPPSAQESTPFLRSGDASPQARFLQPPMGTFIALKSA